MPEFTPHQDAALKAVAGWLKDRPGEGGTPQLFRLFGYAGTGKTTLARHLAAHIDGEVKFAAFTGKAALVMRRKGCGGATTIHSLIYRARESGEETPTFELWDDAPGLEGEADRDRRMLDGRRRAGARPDVVRRAGAGAGRSGAASADRRAAASSPRPSRTRC